MATLTTSDVTLPTQIVDGIVEKTKTGSTIAALSNQEPMRFGPATIVTFDDDVAAQLTYRLKRAGHVASKGRFVAAQLDAYLAADRWLASARRANAAMARLLAGLAELGHHPQPAARANIAFLPVPDDVAARWPWNKRSAPTSLEENIDGMPEDDDLNYPILALELLERHGPGFTTDDVAQLWLDHLPAGRVFTAERAAYRNILDARPVPETATHLNPFREWIGALIRTDLYGWTHPGDVRTAARLAWTDARLSHTRNGVYGAMWAAALGAAAMTAGSVEEVLDAAQTVLPPRSRIAAAVGLGREAAAEGDVRSGLDRLHAAYGDLHWVHVLNNAAVISYALARGGGEFGPSVSIAVTAGWDTDSAAATVGGVVGALAGVDGIGGQWTRPLDGRIATSLPGGERRIDELAARTAALAAARPAPGPTNDTRTA